MTSRTNAPSWPPFCCRLQKQRVKSPLLWFYREREKHRMNHFSLLCDFKMKREVKIPAAVFVNARIVVALISSLFRTVILYSCWFGFPVAQKPAMSSVVTVRTFLILMAAMFVAWDFRQSVRLKSQATNMAALSDLGVTTDYTAGSWAMGNLNQ